MKTKILFILLFFLGINFLIKAEKNYAEIYISRTAQGSQEFATIQFNNKTVYNLPHQKKVYFKIYTLGKLELSIIDRFTTNKTLIISEGEKYFFEYESPIPQNGYLKEINGSYFDFDDSLLAKFEEDINKPMTFKIYKPQLIIQQENMSNVSNISENNNLNNTKNNSNKQENIAENKNRNLNKTTKSNIDVDMNIPENNIQYEYRFALIIGNEDYSTYQRDLGNEVNVNFAERDATVFKEYGIKTLGIPEENILFLINAKSIEMDRALKQINLLSKNSKGKAELIFYYAGHGLPDEITKEPYLIPVDVSASDLKYAFKISDVYKRLTEFSNLKVTVVLDACFSGGARNQGLLTARGVKIKAKDELLNGNIIVFSASSGEQSALPYKDKKHGMFTYFLLKKIQETKGNITYKELSEYINEQVSLKSVLINNKEQNPQTNISSAIQNEWLKWKIK